MSQSDVRSNIFKQKSYQFSLRILSLYKFLRKNREYVIARQVLRSGTSVGVNVEEAISAYSKKEFVSKMSVVLEEANETKYWIKLVMDSYLIKIDLSRYLFEVDELTKILGKIIKTSRSNMKK